VTHYFSKIKVAEIKVQAHKLKKGDRLVIMGKTTGVEYGDVESIVKDDQVIEETDKPDLVTIPLKKRVRLNDKVYILKKRALNVIT
jgi:putative protease